MPHFVIDCSPNILALKSADIILKEIHDTADVPVISMNVSEFERATYCNRNLI